MGMRRGSYDLGVRYVLQSERMGHEVPGMRGVYSHITPGMREDLTAGRQELWEASVHERARISARSPVQVLSEGGGEQLADESLGQPLFVPLGGPALVADEQPVDLGQGERVDDGRSVALGQL